VGVDELDGDQLVILHAVGGCDAQWVFEDGLDGSPDVDYLVAAFEKGLSLIGKVEVNTVWSRCVGLVDVDSLDWSTETWGRRRAFFCFGAGVDRFTADGMVEDKDLGSAGARVGRQ
jgi:hypothetical protein